MLTQEQMNEIEKVFIENQWVKDTNVMNNNIHFRKQNENNMEIVITFVFRGEEIYLDIGLFETCVSFDDLVNMTANEAYNFLLKHLNDQFSDNMNYDINHMKAQQNFINSQIKES